MSDLDRPGTPPGGPTPPFSPDEALRLERRRFFRVLAGDAVRTAATLVGAAGALRDTTQGIADGVLGESGGPAARGTPAAHGTLPARGGPATPAAPGIPTGFMSPFRLEEDRLVLVDQRRLPDELVEVVCESAGDVAQAIREMVVRGAPALGQVAAAGLALAADRAKSAKPYVRRAILRGSSNALVNARPTAVSIRWATSRMLARYAALGELVDDGPAVALALREEAEAIIGEATADHAVMARLGAGLLPDPPDRPLQLLTHCNTGPLACGQIGTALGVVQALAADGRAVHVYVDETRPWLQGARLTAWELAQAGHPVHAPGRRCRGLAARLGSRSTRSWSARTGSRRTATPPTRWARTRWRCSRRATGCPSTSSPPAATLDGEALDGSAITIEMRNAAEVTSLGGRRIAPAGATAYNPSFDVTPAELITALVTEAGVLRAPYGPVIAAAIEAREAGRTPSPADPDAPAVESAAGDG